MKIEDEVVSIDLSKKLKQLGVLGIFSLFRYDIHQSGCGHELKYFREPSESSGAVPTSAFTASELMELIPHNIDTKQNEPFNNFRFNMQRSVIVEGSCVIPTFIINYHCDTMQFRWGSTFSSMNLINHNIYDKSLCDALAKTLIYLIEECLIGVIEN
jgi:hypothetical protein